VSPCLDIHSVLVGTVKQQSITIPVKFPIGAKETRKIVETHALIDCGAGGKFIDQNFARKLGLELTPLKKPLPVRNVDGTLNKKGSIKHKVQLRLKVGDRIFNKTLLMSGLGKQKAILGLPWLTKHNPDVNWQTGEIKWRDKYRPIKRIKTAIEEVADDQEWMNRTVNRLETSEHILEDISESDESLTISYINGELTEEAEDIWIGTKLTSSQAFAMKYEEKEQEKASEERIPEEYHEYLDVFDETKATRFPKSCVWDHRIDMKNGFEPKAFKSYNLSPEEREQQEEFIKENLKLGYIRPSTSSMASPFFFVSKKDGKLRPTQDYRYLNQWTVKNAYPLPLISEIMDKVKASGAKYFTKLDVRWGYNNVRIKKGDEWKAAFKTNTGLFEPTVMFFGLCNSPATFQAMMDSIFKDEVHEGWVIIYMDDILIFSKDKKTLEEQTKRILQKLRENDLYLKAKKVFLLSGKDRIPRDDHRRREDFHGPGET